MRTWEERSMNSERRSDQRTSGIESYVWFRRHWEICPSETHAVGNRDMKKVLSSQVILIPDEKTTVDKEGTSVTFKSTTTSRRMFSKRLLSLYINTSTSHGMFARTISSMKNSSEAADVNDEKHSQPILHRGTVQKSQRRSMKQE